MSLGLEADLAQWWCCEMVCEKMVFTDAQLRVMQEVCNLAPNWLTEDWLVFSMPLLQTSSNHLWVSEWSWSVQSTTGVNEPCSTFINFLPFTLLFSSSYLCSNKKQATTCSWREHKSYMLLCQEGAAAVPEILGFDIQPCHLLHWNVFGKRWKSLHSMARGLALWTYTLESTSIDIKQASPLCNYDKWKGRHTLWAP